MLSSLAKVVTCSAAAAALPRTLLRDTRHSQLSVLCRSLGNKNLRRPFPNDFYTKKHNLEYTLKVPDDEEVSEFLRHNYKKYPPQKPEEKPRNAFVCHEKRNIKYSPKKMWPVVNLIRGMTIEDAINQMKFCHKKGAAAVLEVLLEAQKIAVEEHNVEFPSNLWVSESFCMQDAVIKGVRRHGKMHMTSLKYRYVRYCCTLEEGTPPKHYYSNYAEHMEPQEKLEEWLSNNRKRTIWAGL